MEHWRDIGCYSTNSYLPKRLQSHTHSGLQSMDPTLYRILCTVIFKGFLNSLSTNFTKWSNTLKQFVGNLPTNCLSVFGYFVGLALKGLTQKLPWQVHLPQLKSPIYHPDWNEDDWWCSCDPRQNEIVLQL